MADNAANRQAFEAAQAEREEQIARDQRDYEAEKTRLAAEHEAAMTTWREASQRAAPETGLAASTVERLNASRSMSRDR